LTKEAFQEKLLSFVRKFEKDKHHYLSKEYLEAQVRQDFIDPLFEALGWDIENKKGKKRGHPLKGPCQEKKLSRSKEKSFSCFSLLLF